MVPSSTATECAVADISIPDVDGNGNGYLEYDSFQSGGVPEPSSFVLAASGALMILIFAWTRGFFNR